MTSKVEAHFDVCTCSNNSVQLLKSFLTFWERCWQKLLSRGILGIDQSWDQDGLYGSLQQNLNRGKGGQEPSSRKPVQQVAPLHFTFGKHKVWCQSYGRKGLFSWKVIRLCLKPVRHDMDMDSIWNETTAHTFFFRQAVHSSKKKKKKMMMMMMMVVMAMMMLRRRTIPFPSQCCLYGTTGLQQRMCCCTLWSSWPSALHSKRTFRGWAGKSRQASSLWVEGVSFPSHISWMERATSNTSRAYKHISDHRSRRGMANHMPQAWRWNMVKLTGFMDCSTFPDLSMLPRPAMKCLSVPQSVPRCQERMGGIGTGAQSMNGVLWPVW